MLMSGVEGSIFVSAVNLIIILKRNTFSKN